MATAHAGWQWCRRLVAKLASSCRRATALAAQLVPCVALSLVLLGTFTLLPRGQAASMASSMQGMLPGSSHYSLNKRMLDTYDTTTLPPLMTE